MPSLPPTDLPIEPVVPAVADALAERGVAVLSAPPGSGKTTIVPLRLLAAPWRADGKIVVLEPRRLATRAAARWMAHLLGEDVGGTVGYVTRDDRRVSRATVVEVVTEGVLTRRLQRDPELPGTDIVVFDEFHERNLQTDLGLALTLDTRATLRPKLRVLVMSATLDADRVATLLGGAEPAPVITGESRMHPVDVRWQPLPRRGRIDAHTAATVQSALRAEDGDVLVFLPGMGEIMRVKRALDEAAIPAAVLPLHGSLPIAAQDEAIAPSPPGRRKVVLSTDIAETSLTVEGVRVVIDSGLARAPRFDPRTGMTRLRTISISKASAEQRSGRAGRTEPGVAYRLWSKLEHGGRTAHIDPEITQVDLAGLALELAAWGVTDRADLPWLDPPPSRAFQEARLLLERLGAVDGAGRITAMGRDMVRLPLHPRLAHMVAAAGDDQPLACALAALIDDRDVMRGHPDELPVDVAERARLLSDPAARHPKADGRSVARARRNAEDLARRARVTWAPPDPDHAGRVLALAFPDRLAIRRGSPGRFQLRTRTTAWMPAADPLAPEQFLVAADLDGKRKDARIRLAAVLDADEVIERFGHEIEARVRLVWEGDRLVERTEQRLGGISLRTTDRRPAPGEATGQALLTRLRANDLADLAWSQAADTLRRRVAFLHGRDPEGWPDWSPRALARDLERLLGPKLAAASGLDDLASVDMAAALRRMLTHTQIAALDRLAPAHVTVPSGRRVAVDYGGETPTIAVRVQEMFGSTTTPQIGGEPVVLELLSPAERPVQVTRDLAGFWAGSWAEVRKEMAGRYPKHPWPEDPARARPKKP